MISRERKILRISQAHVAPGMSLERWREILARHGVNLAAGNPWPKLSDGTVAAIFDEIAGIVTAARAASGNHYQIDAPPPEETFDPVDLYWPGEGLSSDHFN
ncbi:MAG: hypothetical protein BroJett011_62980 [Chloroflexota bacterium]|nr:MAG: hypothetical protein BroJett011_62980 [Chloroflexota bacterium]